MMTAKPVFFDSEFKSSEQLPRQFTVSFEPLSTNTDCRTKVSVDGMQAGDVIDDNSRDGDAYRFHDVFHYTFAALLGWSPCTRVLMKRKRKSDSAVDKFEDGARATITEEAISLLVFNKAKQKGFFEQEAKVGSALLKQIKEMTAPFEVSIRSKQEWQEAILIGYSLFRSLAKHNGGRVYFDMLARTASYEKLKLA